MSSWCTIESDPGVFSELITLFGVQDVSVEEIYSLDDLSNYNPTTKSILLSNDITTTSYGLIFLFKWKKEVDTRVVIQSYDIPDLFFAKQVVTNACATQAILSVLLNSPSINLSPLLINFKDFAMNIDSESKGIAIGESNEIRLAHNSFARPDIISQEDVQKNKSRRTEDAYHFIAYVPFQGKVYELDGLKPGPILIGDLIDGLDWLQVVRPAIEDRMNRYSASETHFTLLSICPKKSIYISKEIEKLRLQIESITIEDNENDHSLDQQIIELQNQLNDEIGKENFHKLENARRRHNYLPIIIILIKELAKKRLLDGIRANAVNRRDNNPSRNNNNKK